MPSVVHFKLRPQTFTTPSAHGVLVGSTVAAMVLLALPFVALVLQLLKPEYETWSHLADTVLNRYFINSLTLGAGVMAGTFVIGTTAAWLCSVCEFPGRRFFEWVLILPLAYPPYIIAYTYTGMFDYGGPLYEWLRAIGIENPLPIRSLGGAIAMLTLVLYPYVYLLARAAFIQQSYRLIEAGRTLGAGPYSCFTRVALPAARPAIIAGVAIAVMETLADYGTVKYFGVSTFSVGILRTWFGLGSLTAAAQLSVLLLVFVVIILVIEKRARKRARYHDTGAHPLTPGYHLRGTLAGVAFVSCALPPTLGFAVPTLQLLAWAIRRFPTTEFGEYTTLIANSFALALAGALTILIITVVIAYARRLHPSAGMNLAVQTISSGYAVPGVVIAVGVLILFSALGNWTGIALGGGITALMFAYTIRFLMLGYSPVEAGLEKIPPNLDYAARTLAASTPRTLARIHAPLLRSSILTASLMVFVEIIKELPATLVLRPFNFNTLAVKTFELASDERLADIALPALSIVAIGVLPMILLAKLVRSR